MSVTLYTLEQDLGLGYPPGTRQIDNQLCQNNHPTHQQGAHWYYSNTRRAAPLNFDNCSFRDGRYFFTKADGTEAEWAWDEIQANWVPPPQYREPEPVIPEDSKESEEEEETPESDPSDIQIPVDTQNPQSNTNMLAPGPTDPPTMGTQPGRGKVRLPKNFSGDRTQSQHFILQCLLFAAESDHYKMDHDRISLVLSCMRYGTVGVWAENYLNKTVGVDPPKDLGE